MTKKMVPEVRFEGYEEEWEVILLSNLMTFSNGINAPKESYGKGRKMISVLDILDDTPLKYEEIRNSVSVNKDVENSSRVDKGDLVFVRSSEVVSEVGWAKAYLDEKYALYSGFSIRGKRKDKYEALFLELSINETARKQIERKSGGSTRFNVNQSILNKLKVAMPSLDEQKVISHIFKILNTNINFRKHELTKLQNFKQAMLQKMFPKEGETVPEVGFKGLSGEWEKIRIGDIGLIITGNTPSTTDTSNYDIDGTLWITPTDIKGTVTTQSVKKLSDKGVSKARIVPKGSILVTSIASIGKNTLIKESSGFNQQINAVVPNEGFNSYFLLTLSELWSNEMKRTASSGTMQIVNRTQFSLINTTVPSYNEQVRIGSFFKELDSKIKLEEQNLQKLKQFKKAMLQKMFV